ncbi:hypothetical protein GCM10027280_03880 [Micromonospora polyrhachis]|uniref:DUF2568 domain-containing protein n=1 Tax=Micromonospora polyrhachis TaxID=1282883 RepID=A0A7W7SN69_9ACTN|nr:YrdB family protein [Micromonospora polyrhachis]MBB4957312.1 hypothetical protein [Micromonospora polyrhachis]
MTVALGLRFLLELAALAALAYGGWQAPAPIWVRLFLSVLLPLAAVAIWGRWVAPKGRKVLPDPLRLIPEWCVFGGGALALVAAGHPWLGVALALLAAGDRLALWWLDRNSGDAAPTDQTTPLRPGDTTR